MPLPRIPEGFTFQSAFVQVSCDSDSAYELHHEETTPEGVEERVAYEVSIMHLLEEEEIL